jgi:hypothetical protein
MTKSQGKKGLIVTIIVLGLTLLAVSGIVVWQNLNKSKSVEVSNDASTQSQTPAKEETKPEDAPAVDPGKTTAPTVDPSTLTSINIDPLGITVFYTKGTPGFEYGVLRTSDRTEYVEFSAPELVGTKCTNDTGAFASIIKSPASPEDKTTISQTVVVGGVTYGLSLTGKNCTANLALLEKYQSGFSNGFSQLKGI